MPLRTFLCSYFPCRRQSSTRNHSDSYLLPQRQLKNRRYVYVSDPLHCSCHLPPPPLLFLSDRGRPGGTDNKPANAEFALLWSLRGGSRIGLVPRVWPSPPAVWPVKSLLGNFEMKTSACHCHRPFCMEKTIHSRPLPSTLYERNVVHADTISTPSSLIIPASASPSFLQNTTPSK